MKIELIYNNCPIITHSKHQNTLNNLIQKMAINYGIYGSVFNRPALESVLKKCSNIRKVILCFLSNTECFRNA